MITVTSWRLNSPVTRLFGQRRIHANDKEDIKTSHGGSFVRRNISKKCNQRWNWKCRFLYCVALTRTFESHTHGMNASCLFCQQLFLLTTSVYLCSITLRHKFRSLLKYTLTEECWLEYSYPWALSQYKDRLSRYGDSYVKDIIICKTTVWFLWV